MTSKDHKAWYLPMVLSGEMGTPKPHEGYSRVADIVKKAVAGSTLTANLTGPGWSTTTSFTPGFAMACDPDRHRGHGSGHPVRHLSKFRHHDAAADHHRRIGECCGATGFGVAELGLGISSQTITLMTTMMAGAGIDYAVFLISRYHDYLRQGMNSDEAVAKALTSIGKSLPGRRPR